MNEPILPKLQPAFACPHVMPPEAPQHAKIAVLIGWHPQGLALSTGMEHADFHFCAACSELVLQAIDKVMEGHREPAPAAGST